MSISGSSVLYSFNPGNSLETITEGVGTANSSALVELTVNLGVGAVTDSGAPGGATTRLITKQEVLQALLIFTEQIARDTSGKLG
jgi:hypothetical protein